MTAVTAENDLVLSDLAGKLAREASEDHFHNRRGSFDLGIPGVIAVYNNNPYSRGAHVRDEETDRFRAKLAAAGMKEVGFGTYPTTGKDAGYTYAMIVRSGEGREQLVLDLYREATKETFAQM